jgi:hypothetical protein
VPRYGSLLTVLDSADYKLPGISTEVRALISPQTNRRYYKKVEY